MTLRVLVVDDEAPARRRLRRLLADEPDVRCDGECADGRAALDTIRRDRPDLVFLDVQMPILGGLDVVSLLAARERPAIVFATAFDTYAMQAFDMHAVDYLLKPFSRERFRVALARARERITSRRGQDELAALAAAWRERYLRLIPVKARGRTVVVGLELVERIEAAGNYVRLITGAREYLAPGPLTALERQLDPAAFVRIHRSTIVRIDRVREFHTATHGDRRVVLASGTTLTLSRAWRERVRRVFSRI